MTSGETNVMKATYLTILVGMLPLVSSLTAMGYGDPPETHADLVAQEAGPERGARRMAFEAPLGKEPASNPGRQLPVAGSAAGRLAVPPAPAVRAALAKVEEIFREEYAAANTSATKGQLAKQLMTNADADPEPAAQWTLLNEALRLAVDSGEVAIAFKAADQIVQTFAVEPDKAMQQLCRDLIRTVPPQATRELARRMVTVADQALAIGDDKASKELSTILAALARKSRDPELVKESNALRQTLKERLGLQEQLEPMRAALRANPDDPDANLKLGLMLWTRGENTREALRMLAKGADKELASLAEAELEADSKTAATALVAKADRWWAWGEKQKADLQMAAENLAAVSYRTALPSLTGLEKLRVERRLSDTNFADTRPGASVPLGSMQESGLQGSDNTFFKNGTWSKNKPFLWQGKEHPTALFYAPKDDSTTVIRYDVPKGATKLQGAVGVFERPGMPDNWRPSNPVSFSIIGDGKVLWQSPQLKELDSGARFAVDVSRISNVELRTTAHGRVVFPNAAWFDTAFVK